jgi:asparagine synthase (glutamine-hydrolysing)
VPGIFGACKEGESAAGIAPLMEQMISVMTRPGVRIERFFDPKAGYCLGRASLGVINASTQPVEAQGGNCVLVFHGEVYDTESADNTATHVLEEYLRKGDRCVENINGVFHFAVYDRQSATITLFADKFGLQPIYYATPEGAFLFAGEIRALLCDDLIEKEPDYWSLADFLHYGQILGIKTPFRDIKVLAPGSVLTFNMRTRKAEIRKYWNLDSVFMPRGERDETVSSDEVVDSLLEAVEVRSSHHDLLGLSLSAGLDSRALVAGLGKRSQGLHTYTLGLSGCADQILSERIARIAGAQHKFVELTKKYIDDFENMAVQMILLSDGMFHPHESTEMLALEYLKQGDFKVLLRGHGGELSKAALAFPVMVTPELDGCLTGLDALNYIYKITNRVCRDADARQLFTDSFCEYILDDPLRSLRDSCGQAAERLDAADLCIYFYINEHVRRGVVSSLEIFRTQVEVRLPYLDEGFVSKLFHLPLAERMYGEIQHKLIRKRMPALIKVPNSNTGAPLDAGAFRLFITENINTLFKRWGIKGFRHYTEFSKWHREGFREVTQRILFDGRLADRKIFRMDGLQSLSDRHLTGKSDYGRLLGTAIGIELWFRAFVDRN